MKVLQINSVCGIGSTGRIATNIHNLLLDKGHESYIAYGRGKAKNCEAAIRIGTNMDVYAHGALTRLFDKHGFGSKRATEKFIKYVKEIDPDVIHLHNIHGYYINIETLFGYIKKENKPVVWTLHDCWAFTGHCPYFDYIGCNRWKSACYSCLQKSGQYVSWIFDNSKNNFIKKREFFTEVENLVIVTPSEWLRRLVEESFLCNYKTNVINNGIDTKVFKPTESNFREKYNIQNKFIILGVANVWEKRKGLEFFISLSQELKSNESIVLIGLNEKQLKDLPRNIIGIAKTESVKELAEIYTAADVFVNPTLEDNFPTVNLEALACGSPVVTFNTGGSAESVDINNGIVIEKGNFEQLLYGVKEIKNNTYGFDRKQISESALKAYDKKTKFENYIFLYQNMI